MVNSPSNSVTQPVLVAEGISKSYGATRALKRVDLECRPGELWLLSRFRVPSRCLPACLLVAGHAIRARARD
jgi:hypothetical protein